MSNAKKVFVPFNINDEVRVKLTDYGRRVLRARHMEFYGGQLKHTPKKEDNDGWSRWQLWDLLDSFDGCLSKDCRVFEFGIEFVQYVRDEPEPQSALVG
jgi:hypothetical protein